MSGPSQRDKAIADHRFSASAAAILFSAGAWAVGLSAFAGMPLWKAAGWAVGLSILSAMLLTGLGGGAASELPSTRRQRFVFVQPWLIAVAFQGTTLYWLSRSARLSILATLLGVGFSVLHWPSEARIRRWRQLDAQDTQDQASGQEEPPR